MKLRKVLIVAMVLIATSVVLSQDIHRWSIDKHFDSQYHVPSSAKDPFSGEIWYLDREYVQRINVNEQYMRSIVRHKIVPLGKRVNPGLEKVVKKMMIAKYGAVGK